jgi:hypothetical protein
MSVWDYIDPQTGLNALHAGDKFVVGSVSIAATDLVLGALTEEEASDPHVMNIIQLVLQVTGYDEYVTTYSIVPLVWAARKMADMAGVNLGEMLWKIFGYKRGMTQEEKLQSVTQSLLGLGVSIGYTEGLSYFGLNSRRRTTRKRRQTRKRRTTRKRRQTRRRQQTRRRR